MTEIRCVKCKRMLMKAVELNIEIKCPKCGYVQRFIGIPPKVGKMGFNEPQIIGHGRAKDFEERKVKTISLADIPKGYMVSALKSEQGGRKFDGYVKIEKL